MSGYFAVVIPEMDLYQGFFLSSEHDPRVDDMIALVKSIPEHIMIDGQLVLQKMANHSDYDQFVIGALSATLIEYVIDRNINGIATASAALAKVLNKKYWLVIGFVQARGTNTIIRDFPPVMMDFGLGIRLPIPVNTIELARESLPCVPEVAAIVARQEKTVYSSK